MVNVMMLALLAAPAAQFTWHEMEGGRIELREGPRRVFVYNYGPQLPAGVPEDRRRCCYLHPVDTPAGVTLTNDFPKDHYHHRGVFWGWPIVETGGKRYDGWMLRGGIRDEFEKWLGKPAGGRTARLAVRNLWKVGETAIVAEEVRLLVQPAAGRERVFEVELQLEALGGTVTLRGVGDQKKSYGGFNARFAPRTETVIHTDKGDIAKDEDLVNHAWAALEGLFGGKRAGMRIESNAANAGGAPQWCLRNYGFVGPCYPGKGNHVLEQGKPLVLRYKVTVYDLP